MARKKIQDLVGTTLGNYKIIRCLGKGGMGTVYLGEHPTIRSKVAIKVLLPRFVADEEVTQRFLDEALAVNSIGHPGIVRIHDCDDHDDIGVYLIMEFLDGKSLQQVLDTEHELSTAAAAVVIMQAASALNACHKAGIIHRDLKPTTSTSCPIPTCRPTCGSSCSTSASPS